MDPVLLGQDSKMIHINHDESNTDIAVLNIDIIGKTCSDVDKMEAEENGKEEKYTESIARPYCKVEL